MLRQSVGRTTLNVVCREVSASGSVQQIIDTNGVHPIDGEMMRCQMGKDAVAGHVELGAWP
jgi:hypothetical protein